jgi:Holliday junction resolvasome RuvABC endonuclease subunit
VSKSVTYKNRQIARFSEHVKVKNVTGPMQVAKHTCSSCGIVFNIAPAHFLDQSKAVCSSCYQRKIVADFIQREKIGLERALGLLVPNIRCKNYQGGSKLGEFACVNCKQNFKRLPRDVVKGKTNCEICMATPGANNCLGYTNAVVESWARNHVPHAATLKVSRDGGIPLVQYKFHKNLYMYWADMLTTSSKGVVTLFSVAQVEDFWGNLRLHTERGRACRKQGLQQQMLIVTLTGTIVLLNDGWWVLPPSQIEMELAGLPTSPRILSIDPGTTNAAWSASEYDRKTKKYKLLASGKLINTLHDLTTQVDVQLAAYSSEVRALLTNYKVDALCMERYQARGMKGTTIELVNLMIGATLAEARRTGRVKIFRTIPASQWKNAWNRIGDLEAYYQKVTCVVHQADAVGIGVYCIAEWFGINMQLIMGDKALAGLLKQITKTDTLTQEMKGKK